MHTNDIDEEKSLRRSNANNTNDGVTKVRAKTELQTKPASVMTSRKTKDSNKFVPKVCFSARFQVWMATGQGSKLIPSLDHQCERWIP